MDFFLQNDHGRDDQRDGTADQGSAPRYDHVPPDDGSSRHRGNIRVGSTFHYLPTGN